MLWLPPPCPFPSDLMDNKPCKCYMFCEISYHVKTSTIPNIKYFNQNSPSDLDLKSMEFYCGYCTGSHILFERWVLVFGQHVQVLCYYQYSNMGQRVHAPSNISYILQYSTCIKRNGKPKYFASIISRASSLQK